MLPLPNVNLPGRGSSLGQYEHLGHPSTNKESLTAESFGDGPEDDEKPRKRRKMAEPRARAARHKGQLNFPSERT